MGGVGGRCRMFRFTKTLRTGWICTLLGGGVAMDLYSVGRWGSLLNLMDVRLGENVN